MQKLSTEIGQQQAGMLKEAWQELRKNNTHLRIRDAAKQLDVSEAELLATECGITVTRLAGNWIGLVKELHGLGPLMALTRNDHAVHEKTGLYTKLQLLDDWLLVSGHNIDLCLLMSHWHLGFAVTEETHAGGRYSLQFFDDNGGAVHKVYMTDLSRLPLYLNLVNAFRSADQSQEQVLSATTSTLISDTGSVAEDMPEMWQRIAHCCLNAAEQQEKFTLVQLASHLFWEFMHQLAQLKLPLQIVVKNQGAIQLHNGPVHNLRITGPWLNVLDDGFNLHLNENGIVDLRAVTIAYRDRQITGLELYDGRGQNFISIFGEYDELNGENLIWRDLVISLPGEKI